MTPQASQPRASRPRTSRLTTTRPNALGYTLRGVLAASLLVSGGVHLERWFAGYAQIPTVIAGSQYQVIGPLFLVNALAAAALAVAVLVWRRGLVLLAAAAFGAGTTAAFFADRALGLFTAPGPIMWTGPEVLALAAQLITIAVAVALLVLPRWVQAPAARR